MLAIDRERRNIEEVELVRRNKQYDMEEDYPRKGGKGREAKEEYEEEMKIQ